MIGDRACENCKFVHVENDRGMTCRRHAPTGHPIFRNDKVSGVVGCWPSVAADAYCHEFERRGAVQ